MQLFPLGDGDGFAERSGVCVPPVEPGDGDASDGLGASEERYHVVRTVGRGRHHVVREGERVVSEGSSGFGDPFLGALAVCREECDADGVERDLLGAVGLGALLGDPAVPPLR